MGPNENEICWPPFDLIFRLATDTSANLNTEQTEHIATPLAASTLCQQRIRARSRGRELLYGRRAVIRLFALGLDMSMTRYVDTSTHWIRLASLGCLGSVIWVLSTATSMAAGAPAL
jgi:hypothetical protein